MIENIGITRDLIKGEWARDEQYLRLSALSFGRKASPAEWRFQFVSGMLRRNGDGPESQIDPGRGDLGGLRYAMLPEGLGCALHDQEAPVLELNRDRIAATFAFVSKGKFPFSAEAYRADHYVFPERLFVVAVPAQAFAAITVQIAKT